MWPTAAPSANSRRPRIAADKIKTSEGGDEADGSKTKAGGSDFKLEGAVGPPDESGRHGAEQAAHYEIIEMKPIAQKMYKQISIRSEIPLRELVERQPPNIFVNSPSQVRTGKGVNTWSSTAATRNTAT